MDEFLILLQAKLDEAKSKGNVNADIEKLQNQLNKLKVQVEIDPKATQKLANDIGKLVNQKIIISNIGINQSSLSKTGEQIGQVISDSAEKVIGNVTSKNIRKYFKVNSSDSRQFQAEMEKLVSGWTNGKGKVTDINIQTRTSYDKDAGKNIERLHQATVTYKNELDEVIKKTIAWRQIGTTTNAKGEEVALRGFVEVAGQYSKAIDTVSAKTDSFAEKQQKAVASAKNALSSIESKLHDPNITKSLAGTDFNANGLNSQLEKVRSAISVLDNASRDTFTQAKIDVDTEITSLNNLISTLKNAEYAATSLRTKGLETTKDVYASKLDVLVTKMKSSGAYTNGFRSGVDNLKNILNVATDTSGLTAFLNGFDKLEAGYKRAEASAKAFNQAQKVGINVSGLQSKITDLQRISPEIDNFKTNINGADVTVQSLYRDLEKVNTQSDLGVIKEKFKAFTDAAKSAGIAVTDVGNSASQSVKESSLLLKELEKSYQNIKNLQIQKSTLDPIVDSSKISKLNEEITKAKNDYNNAFRSASVNGNFDISAWKEIKSTIDSATKSKIEYNNAGKIDYLNEQKNNLSNTLSNLKSSLIENGLYTDELKQKIETLESELVNISNKGDLSTFKENLKSIESEIGTLSQVNKIQLSMTDKSAPKDNYDLQIKKLTDQLSNLGLTNEEVAQKTRVLTEAQAELKKVIDSTNYNSINEKNQAILSADEKRSTALNQVKNAYEDAKLAYDKYMQPVSSEKATSLINKINSFLTKNTKITNDAKVALQGYIDELGRGVNLSRWNEINGVLKKTENSMRGLGRLGASLKDQMSQAAQSFTQWLSVSSVVMLGVSKTKEAISELIELDSILTEISKTSDLTNQQLRELGNTAFDSASKYGRSAADYLTGVQEMYRAGFKNAEEMAELSLLAQAAGDMESNSANDYLMATNAAYNYKGSVEELNKVLDSQNYITNNAAVSMQDMADATSEAASIAAQYGVEIDELSALIAVATSKTRESGSEVGTALKSIFVTLQDTTSKPVVEAFDAVGISMTKIVNGSEQLKTPIELLKELSVAFNELQEGDTKRANILTDIGKKYHANTLSAILSDWESYESMLELYSQGIGSAADEAEKSANNIEGSLNRLSNTWTDTIENILNSDVILTVVKALNGLLSVINNVTDKLGSLGTIGLGAGLFAGVKNTGKCRISVRIS